MRATPAFDVSHTSRRIVSTLASFAVALTIARFAFAQRPGAQRSAAGLDDA